MTYKVWYAIKKQTNKQTNYPNIYDIPSITHKLNKIETSISFQNDLEKSYCLTFLELLLINNGNKLKFKVYHKNINKNDNIQSY